MTKRELVKQELLNCSNFKKVSEKCKVSQWLVSEVAKEIGVFNKINRVKTLENDIEKLFKEGYNLKQIGEKLNLWYHTVGKILKKKGFVYSSCNKKNINSNIFNNINTEESAYWLGFLYADGYVSPSNSIELSLKEEDLEHLDKFKQFLNWNGEIKYRPKLKCYRIIFKDNIIGENLKKLGCLSKKSLILTFPSKDQVPDYLIHHFVRGYFDGDGYISNCSKSITISILGTFNFLKSLHEKFELPILNIKKKQNIFYNSLNGDKARTFMKILYSESTVYLSRKQKKFECQIKKK